MDTVVLAQLTDDELVARVKQSACDERRATAALIAALSELDARKLYLGEGCSSLFAYCTRVLHLSEHAAYGRIEAARTARRFPAILGLLADGAVTLTTIVLLAPHLTHDNHQALLDSACNKTKREVEHLVAALRPKADVRAAIRKLPASLPRRPVAVPEQPTVACPASSTAAPSPMPVRPAVVHPLAPERYKVQFTVSRETYDKLIGPAPHEFLRCVTAPDRTEPQKGFVDSGLLGGRALLLQADKKGAHFTQRLCLM